MFQCVLNPNPGPTLNIRGQGQEPNILGWDAIIFLVTSDKTDDKQINHWL